LPEADGVSARTASFVCGSFVEIAIRVDEDTGVINTAVFRTNGCGYMVAAADVLCEWLAQKKLAELHGLTEGELVETVYSRLGSFPAERDQCAAIAFEALRNAMSLYRERRIEEFQGEKPLICTCFGISEDSIAEAVATNGFTEVGQVIATCRAGSGCGSCRMLIQEIIDSQDVHAPRP
jgi:NifU-like protein